MASLGSIFVDLIARTGKYSQGLKSAADGTTKFERTVKSSLRSVDQAFQSIGSALIAGGFTALIASAVNAAGKFKDLSDRTGLAASTFSALNIKLLQTGTDVETFASSIGKLNDVLGNALKGESLEAVKAFDKLGLSVKALTQLPTEQRLDAVTRSIAKLSDQAEQTEAIRNIFGKGGDALLPIIKETNGELLKFADAQKKAGNALSDDDIKRIDDFGDQWTEAVEKIKLAMASALPALKLYLDGLLAIVNLPENAFKAGQDLARSIGLAPKLPAALPSSSSTIPGQGSNAQLLNADKINKSIETRKKLLESINDSLNKQTTNLEIQNDRFGESESIIQSLIRAKEIEAQLAQAGVVLSEKERDIIQEKLNNLRIEASLNEELTKAEEERLRQQEEISKKQQEEQQRVEESIQNIREDLAGSLVDVIKGARSLGDAFKDVAARIAEAVIQAELLKAITDATGQSSPGKGITASSIGSFFSNLLSFDVGTSYVPYDMIAQIHQGEMIIPAAQASMMRSGQDNPGITMNVYTPDANSFRASDRQIARQLKSRVATS